MAEVTPMMQKYLETKQAYPDCILFYRLGDFYEMFFEDALLASKELDITLTGKSCGLEERAPMCGVPYHAVDVYLNKLVSKGYKVAICEQMEDPKLAKGLVKREVIRIVTPGTNCDIAALDENKNNFLACIYDAPDRIGLAIADVTTGDFDMTEVADFHALQDELQKYAPAEILCNATFLKSSFPAEDVKKRYQVTFNTLEPRYFAKDDVTRCLTRHFEMPDLGSLGGNEFPAGILAAGALLTYLYETQMTSLSHMRRLRGYVSGNFMLLDTSTRRNLELTETMRDKQKKGSLLGVLDKTKTAMGARLLRKWLEQPLIHKDEIVKRQDAVSELHAESILREEMREYLAPVYDLERLLGKISYKSANPRDLLALCDSFRMLPPIRQILADATSSELCRLREQIDPLDDLCALLEKSIEEDPPLLIREGGIIKDGYSQEVDTLRLARTEGKNWLAALEQEDRERTGIKNLRIKYNKVFGYYFEVTNSYKDLVPEDYIRKQTLAGAERYTTPRLKELEDTILNAEDKLNGLEYDIFCAVRDKIAEAMERIQQTAQALACLDVYASLATVAEQNHYIRPSLNEDGIIEIKDGRHPVVEQSLSGNGFIPNDTYLDNGQHMIAVITGPNMAGKSTYMRQTALIVLLAQIGSFVPAGSANIGIVDRIFTRVGASDDLASGQSTFMVEMSEVANILRNATAKSLLILDEIGRGTSTYDGLAIAWAVIEHISDRRLLGAKTLFATHYHELTELEGKMDNVNNYCIAVKEQGDDIIFLRKIMKGGADKSYGIQVAKLAGVPNRVIERAKKIVEELSGQDITEKVQHLTTSSEKKSPAKKKVQEDLQQLSFADAWQDQDILRELHDLDLGNVTPIEALNTLSSMQERLKERW